MSIEIALLISCVTLAFGIYQGISNMKRSKAFDDKKDASELTTVIVKLETIGVGVSEIKSDMRNIKNDIIDLRERVTIVEQSCKSSHHRMDNYESGTKRTERERE